MKGELADFAVKAGDAGGEKGFVGIVLANLPMDALGEAQDAQGEVFDVGEVQFPGQGVEQIPVKFGNALFINDGIEVDAQGVPRPLKFFHGAQTSVEGRGFEIEAAGVGLRGEGECGDDVGQRLAFEEGTHVGGLGSELQFGAGVAREKIKVEGNFPRDGSEGQGIGVFPGVEPWGLSFGSFFDLLHNRLGNLVMVDEDHQIGSVEITLQIAVAALVNAVVGVDMIVVGAAVVAVGGRGGLDQFPSFPADKEIESLALLQVGALDPSPEVFDAGDRLDGKPGETHQDSLGAGMVEDVFFDEDTVKHRRRKSF